MMTRGKRYLTQRFAVAVERLNAAEYRSAFPPRVISDELQPFTTV